MRERLTWTPGGLRTDADRARLGATFDEDAELYDRARPGYPSELFDDLAALAGVTSGRRILEIGCGTGKATVPLAERGCRILAVEPGAALAEIARRNLAPFPEVEVVVAPFEDWPLPDEPFDAVVSATAFHWIDPTVRVRKAADALRDGGALATFTSLHVAGGDDDFFVAVQECYERWDPKTPPGLRLPQASAVSAHEAEPGLEELFGEPAWRRYAWEAEYSTTEYTDLLRTYSGHRALPPAALHGLLDCIADLIESSHGGRISKRYLTELRVVRR